MAAVAQSLASHFSAKKNRSQRQQFDNEHRNVAVVETDASSSSSAFQFAFTVQEADDQQPSSGKKKKKGKKKLTKKNDATVQMGAPQVNVGGYIAVEDAGDLLVQLLTGDPQKMNVMDKSHGAPSPIKQVTAPSPPASKQQSTTTTTESDNESTTKKSKSSSKKKKKKKAAKKQQQQQQQSSSSSSTTTTGAPATPTSTKKSSTKATTNQQEQAPVVPSTSPSSPSFLKLRKATGSESEIAKMQLRYGRGRRNLAAIAQREERKKKVTAQPSSDAGSTAAINKVGPEKGVSSDAGATEFKFNFGT